MKNSYLQQQFQMFFYTTMEKSKTTYIDALVTHIDWAPLFSADCIDKKVDFYGQINDSL